MTTSDYANDKPEIIFAYSRADAISDGELIDLTELSEAMPSLMKCFKVPVAITNALYQTIANIPENCGEYVAGRINDVLFMASLAARSEKDPEENIKLFKVLMTDLLGHRKELKLLLHIGPGDKAEPVITIGFPSDF